VIGEYATTPRYPSHLKRQLLILLLFFKKRKKKSSINRPLRNWARFYKPLEKKKNESPDLDSFIELSKFILRENDVIKGAEPTVGARNLFRAIVL
jgi:hypothetical protein